MIESIIKWWNNLTNKWACERQRKLHNQLKRDCNSVIQLMEFSGKVYISFKGEPVIDVQSLNGNVIDILRNSRQTWTEYTLNEFGSITSTEININLTK